MVRFLARIWLSLKRRLLLRQLRRARLHHVDGVPILVLPDVHDPVVFRTGRLLAQAVASQPVTGADVDDGARPLALDMGTGSGIVAIFAGRIGYRVIGVDINPVAVRCARANVTMNGLEETVSILSGDLFGPVQGMQFDLVAFNPPFFRGEPLDVTDVGWRSPDVIERFAAGLGSVLRPEGRALIVFSSDGDEVGLLRALVKNGFRTEPLVRRDLTNEVLTVYAASSHPATLGAS